MAVVLVSALKKQQLQIQQKVLLEKQEQLSEALQQLVCAKNKRAVVCATIILENKEKG